MAKLAVIKLRSAINARGDAKDAMEMMGLTRVNHCVIVDDDPSHLGTLQKVKDYVTWGEINKDTLEKLLRKRGRIVGDKRVTDETIKSGAKAQTISDLVSAVSSGEMSLDEIKGLKKVFRLHPPRGGYKSTKRSVRNLGDLGYRGERINELILSMI